MTALGTPRSRASGAGISGKPIFRHGAPVSGAPPKPRPGTQHPRPCSLAPCHAPSQTTLPTCSISMAPSCAPARPFPGAVEALLALKANGKAIRAVTNNSRMAHHAVAERFRRDGLPLEDDEVFSALRATARFIAHERPGASVFPFGADGLIYELEEAGLTITDQANAEYVVAGYYPEINLESMKQAMRAILNGARFVAVNTDRRYVGEDGPIPGAGRSWRPSSARLGANLT